MCTPIQPKLCKCINDKAHKPLQQKGYITDPRMSDALHFQNIYNMRDGEKIYVIYIDMNCIHIKFYIYILNTLSQYALLPI